MRPNIEAIREGKEMANQISCFVNSFNTDKINACAEQMTKEHRTLQQNMMRMFIKFVELEAKQDDYDLRNQASIRLSRKIVELIEKESVSLPYV